MNTYHRRIWWSVRPLFAWRLLRLLARAFWLAAGLVIVGRLVSAWLRWPLSGDTWLLLGAAVWVLLFAVLAFWPIPMPGLTRRIDRTLGLRDQISTAYEVARRGPRNYVETRLLDNAGQLLGQASHRFWRSPAVPWSDLELCALALVILYALSVTPGLFAPPVVFGGDSSLPPVAAEPSVPMPGLPPQLSEGGSPFGGEGDGAGDGGRAIDPLAAQEALNALTNALGRTPITQPAASALAHGDLAGAAQELRELADASSEISPEAQQDLGDSLREASDELRDSAPEAAQQLQQAALALQSQDPAQAAQGLEGVAQLIEDLEQSQTPGESQQPDEEGGPAGGAGANAGREQSSGGGLDRLPPEGETLELPEGDSPSEAPGVLLPPEHQLEPEGQHSTPYSQQDGDGSSVGQISDPLNFPWRLRGVVQRYFSAP